MSTWLYAALCVVVPLVWALLVSRLMAWLEARVDRGAPPPRPPSSSLPPPDYSI